MALVSGNGSSSLANSSYVSFALSSLVSVTEEQMESLGDDCNNPKNSQVGPNHEMGRYYYSLGQWASTVDRVTAHLGSRYCATNSLVPYRKPEDRLTSLNTRARDA
jgi:hypothetical protein